MEYVKYWEPKKNYERAFGEKILEKVYQYSRNENCGQIILNLDKEEKGFFCSYLNRLNNLIDLTSQHAEKMAMGETNPKVSYIYAGYGFVGPINEYPNGPIMLGDGVTPNWFPKIKKGQEIQNLPSSSDKKNESVNASVDFTCDDNYPPSKTLPFSRASSVSDVSLMKESDLRGAFGSSYSSSSSSQSEKVNYCGEPEYFTDAEDPNF